MAEEASPNARRNFPLTATNLPSAIGGPSAVVERFGTAVIKALARQSNAEAAQTTPSEPPRALDENQLIAPTKAPETQVSEQALEPRMSDRERLRDLIRAELTKHRPRESARASLELLAESSIMIESGCDTERASGGNEVWSEDAVRRAIDELRRKHPLLCREVKEESHEALDKSPAAAPDHALLDPPAAPAKPQRDWLFLEQGIFERQAHDGLEPLAPAAAAGRYVYAALAAIFTLFVWVGFWAALKPKLGSGYTSVAERTRTPSEAREQKETSALSGQPANGDRTWPAGSQPQGKLKGTPEVIDTATIRLEGKVVRLFGVEWV